MNETPTTSVPSERGAWFHARLLSLLILALMTDSYDLQAASFAAPVLAKVWGVPMTAFGPLFGAGLAGVFAGALLFGWLGDRFGRKRAIVIACLVYGVFSLVSALAANPTQFALLRFLMGVGCGGALPNVVALATELAPAKRRGMMTSLIFVGMPIGGAIPGFVRSGLVPDYGWEVIFIIGGVLPILFGLMIALGLPESPAFLAARKGIAESVRAAPRFLRLLSREWAPTSLLLWVMFAGTLFTLYLVSNWLPSILEQAGLSPGATARINFLHALGGGLAGLALSFVIDRIGLLSLFGFFLLGMLALVIVAFSNFSEGGLALVILFAGFAVTGIQFALNVAAGLIYPPEVRATGVGAGLGIGRIGSILGAMFGAFIVAREFAGRDLFLFPLIPLAIGAVAAFVLMRTRDVRGQARELAAH